MESFSLRGIRNEYGFTLSEIIISLALGVPLSLLLIGICTWQLGELKSAASFNSILNGRIHFLKLLQDKRSWENTYNASENTHLKCQSIRYNQRGSCCPDNSCYRNDLI